MLRTLPLFVFLAHAAFAQAGAANPSWTLDQQEEFLRTAKIVRTRSAPKGVTNTVRATLSDGNITHDASIQTIDERKAQFEGQRGREINFRDTYKFNIAAYRLGRLIGLQGMIPPSIERSYQGKRGSFTWWIDDVIGDESDRLRRKVVFPPGDSWARQWHIQTVFHQLIYNMDPNQGNTLYDKNYRLWMIDHSRAFRLYTTLPDEKALQRCDRVLLEKLKQLDEQAVKAELSNWLEPMEIQGVMARRDRIVTHFEKLGPAALYDWLPK
jgi:hypothetical protein